MTAQAADESNVQKRVTATRLVAVGLFAFAAKKTTGGGNVYVVIDGPRVSGLATVKGDKNSNNGPAAFKFAAEVNNRARSATDFEPKRPAAIASTQADVDRLVKASDVKEAAATYRDAVAVLPDKQRGSFDDVPS